MPAPTDKPFELLTRGSVLVVKVAAERMTDMDATDAFNDALDELLQSEQSKHWVIDFQSVTFMVTPAINTLVNLAKQIRQRGGGLALTGLNDNISQVFSLMRLDEVFAIHADVDAAVTALNRSEPQP